MPNGRNLAAALTLALLAGTSHARAQETDAYYRAQDLEQHEHYEEAAAAYREALAQSPNSVPTILGLERVYAQLGRTDSLLPILDAAIARQPRLTALRAAELRSLRTLGDRERLRAAFERWRHDVPHDPAPYREYARMLIQDGFTPAADSVLRLAQADVGTGRGFEYELAQLRAAMGLFDLSAQSWRDALRDNPYLDQAAVFSLLAAPPPKRAAVRAALAAPPAMPAARKVLALLLLAWGQPRDGWDALRALEPDTTVVSMWVDFGRRAEEAEAWLVARDALVAAAAHRDTPDLSARATGDAMRGGDAPGAVALAAAAERRLDSASAANTVLAAHLRALSALGRAAEGERLLAAYAPYVRPDERATLSSILAWGWIRNGDLVKARAALAQAGDSGDVEAAGWLALYDGDLATARRRLHPTSDASPATLTALAVLQRSRADRAPLVGRAFLTLARGDTMAAAAAFDSASSTLDDAASLLVATAARLYASRGATAQAVPLWQRVTERWGESPEAPESELEWARALRRAGQMPAAIDHLEHLILTYPQSALVPQARRELELAKRAVPATS